MLAVGLSQGAPHHYWYAALDAKLPGKTAGIIGIGAQSIVHFTAQTQVRGEYF